MPTPSKGGYLFYIECRKNPQVFSLLDVRHYPWFLIYSITVFGLASPIEQTKYPSDHKVFSFQKYFLNILSYKRHEKIANCRADYLHKCSISLVRRYDTICVEDLNVKGMERNHHLAKSITDASWGSFVSMLTYKAEWNGKKVVKIDRYFPSSQTCNVCGYVNKQTKDFSVREWECPVCHTHHNRDVNAAINILRFGLNHISAGTVDYTGGEGVRTNLLKGRSSAKPEAHESLARG